MLDDLLKYVPDDRRNAYLGLLQRVPRYARKVCVVGDAGASVGYLLKKRPDTSVVGIVHKSAALRAARQMLDGVSVASNRLPGIDIESLDALVLTGLERDLVPAMALLARIAPRLAPHCLIFALYSAPPGVVGIEPLNDEINTHFIGMAYKRYQEWTLQGDGSDRSQHALARMGLWVSSHYNPLTHARALNAQNNPAAALELLQDIPEHQICSPEFRIAMIWERLQTVTNCLASSVPDADSAMLWLALSSFYELTYALPQDPHAYEEMARCWSAVGDVNMARRLLSSIHHQTSIDRLAQQRSQMSGKPVSTRQVREVPAWLHTGPYRVLFLMNSRPHYGIDVLYDGLCDCLGDANVTDYPYKPWLHGYEPRDLKNYPCRFNRSGTPMEFGAVLAALDGRQFDLILFADVECTLPRDEMLAIMERSGDTPVAVVDALDEFTNFRTRVADHLQFDRFKAYFKREKHRCIDYGPKSYPLPFSYDQRRALGGPLGPRSTPFFWAGHRMFGLRRLYVEALEERQGTKLDTIYTPDDYVKCIRSASIGLNCFGLGFDTVRYWELPAQGTMLLSERLPIEIPFDFIDNRHAVFFDDLPSLIERLSYCEAHPESVAEIAQAGHEHYTRYHTNRARAMQLLGWVSAH